MATRFRLPSSGSAAVSPAFQSYTHASTTRRPLPLTDASALGNTALAPDAADHITTGDTAFFQFVSDPLLVQNLTATSVSAQIQAIEDNQWNTLFVQVWVGLYDNAGTSLIATLLSKTVGATEVATALTNRTISGTTTGYNMQAGDSGARLAVEISLQGLPVAKTGVQGHNGTLRFGSDGASGDLPADETTTATTYNPWIEFGWTLLWQDPKTCTPSAASLTVTGAAPAIRLDKIATPSAGALTTTSYAPTVTATVNQQVTPAAASMTLTGAVPTVTASDHKIAEPAAATVTTTGYEPTVAVEALDITATPDAATLAVTGAAPTVTATANVSVVPDAATISITAAVPTVTATANWWAVPIAAALALTTYAPTVLAPVAVTPDAAAIAVTAYEPTIRVGNDISVVPSAAAIAVTSYAPTVTAPRLVTPDAAAFTLTAYAPTARAADDKTATPEAATATLTASAPTVTATAAVTATPGAATITLTGAAPSVSTGGGASVTVGAAVLTVTTYAPTVRVRGTGGNGYHRPPSRTTSFGSSRTTQNRTGPNTTHLAAPTAHTIGA